MDRFQGKNGDVLDILEPLKDTQNITTFLLLLRGLKEGENRNLSAADCFAPWGRVTLGYLRLHCLGTRCQPVSR